MVGEDESGGAVFYGLESVKKLGGDADVECVAVVPSACDQGLRDSMSGV